MADNKENAPQEESPEQEVVKTKKKKLLLVGILGLGLAAGLGGGIGWFLMGSGKKPTEQAPAAPHGTAQEATAGEGAASHEGAETEKAAQEPNTQAGKAAPSGEKARDGQRAQADGTAPPIRRPNIDFGETYTLKPFHLNLGNPLENRYLRLEIALEYKNGESQRLEIEARLPQLRDAILAVASRKTREFLLGPDGKDQLRLEILNRINQYMDKKIEAVYITDILIE